jgi:hypothetical protein
MLMAHHILQTAELRLMMMVIWFGFEQEYFIMDTKTLLPLGFPIGLSCSKVCTTALLAEKIHTEEH